MTTTFSGGFPDTISDLPISAFFRQYCSLKFRVKFPLEQAKVRISMGCIILTLSQLQSKLRVRLSLANSELIPKLRCFSNHTTPLERTTVPTTTQ